MLYLRSKSTGNYFAINNWNFHCSLFQWNICFLGILSNSDYFFIMSLGGLQNFKRVTEEEYLISQL